jgi:hypothetical protein
MALEHVDVLGHLLDERAGGLILLLNGQGRLAQVEQQFTRELRIGHFRLQLLDELLEQLCALVGLALQLYGLRLGALIVHGYSPIVIGQVGCRFDRAIGILFVSNAAHGSPIRTMSAVPPQSYLAPASSSVLASIDPGEIDAERIEPSVGERVAALLESNHIVYFPRCPIPLPDSATLRFLRGELPSRLRLKNVSYHPEADRLTGLQADRATRERVTAVLREHLRGVTGFLSRVAPHLAQGWTVGTCSFRPIQERGRNLKAHASNELVHIDAGAYGATHGDRILRFFVNVNEAEDRVWASKGSISDLLERHGQAAGLLETSGRLRQRIDKGFGDHAFSALIGGLARLNPLARVLDSSPYDRAMRRLHNYMKDSEAFKTDSRGYEEIRFPPGSAWVVFTDGVSHASIAGQFALVTTMIVRRQALRHPQFAPYSLLAASAASRSITASG